MTSNELLSIDAVPTHIIEKAREVSEWFDAKGVKNWQLYGIESRDYTRTAPMQGDWQEVTNALDCFNAAYAEGLNETLANVPDDQRDLLSLYDLVTRRILPAMSHLQAALSSLPQPVALSEDEAVEIMSAGYNAKPDLDAKCAIQMAFRALLQNAHITKR